MDRKHKPSLRAKNIVGTADCPRMAVYRSLKHIYVQLIDDQNGLTLAAASTLKSGLKPNVSGAEQIGAAVAAAAQKKQINKVVFDRRTRRYHGRVRALAEAARKGGLVF